MQGVQHIISRNAACIETDDEADAVFERYRVTQERGAFQAHAEPPARGVQGD